MAGEPEFSLLLAKHRDELEWLFMELYDDRAALKQALRRDLLLHSAMAFCRVSPSLPAAAVPFPLCQR